MKKLVVEMVATCLAGSAWADDRKQDMEWQVATTAMKDLYCMGEVCLGMTREEVENIPGATVVDWNSNQWERNCSGSFGNSTIMEFTGRDGTKFNVGFFDFPGDAPIQQRFRVRSVSLYVEATRSEFDGLMGELVDRWNMGPGDDSRTPGIAVYSHPSALFTAELFGSFAYLPKRSLISLNAKMDRYPDWLRGQPACQGQNPALPKL